MVSSPKRVPTRKIPLYTRFSTAHNRYLYDAVSQSFLQISPAVYDLVDDLIAHGCESERLTRDGNGRYEAAVVEEARREVQEAANEGMLLSEPAELGSFGSMIDIEKTLRKHCHQIVLEMTRSCNLRCRYCIFSGLHGDYPAHADRHMPRERIEEAIRFYMVHSREEEQLAVSFYGGEPLLRFAEMKHAVWYAKRLAGEKPIHFNLTTNGTLLMPEVVDYLVNNDFFLVVSLDGPAIVHDRFRVFDGGAPTHAAVVGALSRLKEQYPEYYRTRLLLNVVLGPGVDFEQLEAFFSEALTCDLPLTITGIDDPDGEFEQQFNPENEISRGFEKLEERYRQNVVEGVKPSRFLRSLFDANLAKIQRRPISTNLPEFIHPNGICLPGKRRFFVDIDGEIHPCEKLARTMPIGTIRDGFDTAKIAEYVEIYRGISKEDCSRCWAMRWCTLCFKSALGNEGLDAATKHGYCENVKSSWKRAFALYCSILEQNSEALNFLKSVTFS